MNGWRERFLDWGMRFEDGMEGVTVLGIAEGHAPALGNPRLEPAGRASPPMPLWQTSRVRR